VAEPRGAGWVEDLRSKLHIGGLSKPTIDEAIAGL